MQTPRLLLTTLLTLGSAAALSAGPWSVRFGATWLQTTDGSTNSAAAVTIEDKLIPEFDVTYAFNANWSAELVLTVPQTHDVALNGAPIGTFKHLPPTLLAKYTFDPIGAFTPYVGAGVNCTLIFDDNLANGAAKLDNWSIGPAVQVGADYKLDKHWSLNVDVKRAMLRSDVTLTGGTKLTEARLDPWLYSAGLRYTF